MEPGLALNTWPKTDEAIIISGTAVCKVLASEILLQSKK